MKRPRIALSGIVRTTKPVKQLGDDFVPRAMPREHQFHGLTREEWEQTVFEEADHFTVSRYTGRGDGKASYKFDTSRHSNILEAVKDAVLKEGDPGGREPMIYAVAKTGRNVLIPKAKWVEFIREFAKRNPDYQEAEK